MSRVELTLKGVRARPVVVPLRRPVVSKVGLFQDWPFRLGREKLAEDLAAIAAVRDAAGSAVKLMCDFNQGLTLGDALVRCHALDDQGLYWFEEPTTYDNIAGYA